MTKRLSTLAAILSIVAVQTGCGAAAPPPAAPSSYPSAGYPQQEAKASSAPAADAAPSLAAPAAPAPAPPAGGGAPSAPQQQPANGAPAKATAAKPTDTRSAKNAGPTSRAAVIIYQGDLKMAADEDSIPKTIDKIVDVAESLGGHIAGRKDQSVQIKVPSASFRDAMTKIEAIGGVTNRSVSAEDVSEEFHDLEVRLTNLRTTRTRLQDFMGKAASIQDMLTVEKELERVAQEIDRIEGRLEFLRTRAAMSVISVALTPKPKNSPLVVTTPPPPPPRNLELPIPWVAGVGIDPLLSLKK